MTERTRSGQSPPIVTDRQRSCHAVIIPKAPPSLRLRRTAQNTKPAMKKVLFFTHAESGQSNTILALALELQTRPDVQVHILSRRVHGLSKMINFHPLEGSSMVQTLPSRGMTEESIKHPPLTKSWDLYDRLLIPALVVWGGEGSFCRVSLLIGGHKRLPFRVYAHIRELQESDRRNTARSGCGGRNLQSRF